MVINNGQFLGRAIWQRRFGEFTTTLTRYGASEHLPRHQHERPYFCVVLSGGFDEFTSSKEQECHFGTVLLNLADTPHRDRISTDGSLCLNVDLGDLTASALVYAAVSELYYRRTDSTCRAAHRLTRELSESDALSTYATHGLLLDILTETMRTLPTPGKVSPSWVHRVRQEIDERFPEAVSLQELADLVGYHPAHLARAFRCNFGSTVGEYQRFLRAEHARSTIQTSPASLADVAIACGFSDQSHMTRVFRELYGETPASFRRRNARTNAQV